jgi:hypothetical protein
MTEHNYIGLKQPKFNFWDVVVIAGVVWHTWGSPFQTVPVLLNFILAGVYFLARPYLFANTSSPQKAVSSVEDSLRAVIQEQTKARRDDCINEYTDLRWQEHQVKKYLQEHTTRFHNLEAWPGYINIDVTWIDEELPYDYEFRKRTAALKKVVQRLNEIALEEAPSQYVRRETFSEGKS